MVASQEAKAKEEKLEKIDEESEQRHLQARSQDDVEIVEMFGDLPPVKLEEDLANDRPLLKSKPLGLETWCPSTSRLWHVFYLPPVARCPHRYVKCFCLTRGTQRLDLLASRESWEAGRT